MTVVNTNVAALAAQTSMMKNTRELEDAMGKLSSGYRINTAADDAAGMSISERLDSQIRGLSQAIRNAQDGQNLIDTVEGASGEIVVALQRLRELAVQSATDTNSAVDRGFINKEAQNLIGEINRIGSNTQWNGMNVLDGTFVNKNIQAGANVNESIGIAVRDLQARGIGNHVIRGKAMEDAVATDEASNTIAGGDTVISGFAGKATITVVEDDSAREFVADVNNRSNDTGVTADARTNAVLKTLSNDGTVTIKLGKQGSVDSAGTNIVSGTLSSVSVTATITTTDFTNLRDAINNVSGETGVVASFFNGAVNQIMLTDHDGDDIILGDFEHSTASQTMIVQAYDFHGTSNSSASSGETLTDAASDSVTITGAVQLSSSQSFQVESTQNTQFFGAVTFADSSLDMLGDINLGSAVGSSAALDVIDGAINMVNTQRATLGAISNRLDNTVNNLTNIVENTSASKSTIKDANFAAETSKLTKAQILNQAATSMLAQANASKQTVLALLQS